MDATTTERFKNTLLPGNAVAALVMGTVVGSTLLAAVVLIGTLVAGLIQGGTDQTLGSGMLTALLFFLFSLPVWAAGLIVVGIPGWIALHALGWRSRPAGAAFGGGATFVAAMVLGLRLAAQDLDGPRALVPWALALALIGAGVGWVVVATGYGEKEATS